MFFHNANVSQTPYLCAILQNPLPLLTGQKRGREKNKQPDNSPLPALGVCPALLFLGFSLPNTYVDLSHRHGGKKSVGKKLWRINFQTSMVHQ